MTTLGDARAQFLEVNGFGPDGGEALKWVPIKVLGVPLKIPNTDGRRRAVPLHDLHHVLTGYQTDWRGECEIAAWELSTGCRRWLAATVLNLGGLAFGLLLAPRRCARAWALGRQTRNLYGEDGIAHLVHRDVAEVRRELGLGIAKVPVRWRDIASMVGFVASAPIAIVRSLFASRASA